MTKGFLHLPLLQSAVVKRITLYLVIIEIKQYLRQELQLYNALFILQQVLLEEYPEGERGYVSCEDASPSKRLPHQEKASSPQTQSKSCNRFTGGRCHS